MYTRKRIRNRIIDLLFFQTDYSLRPKGQKGFPLSLKSPILLYLLYEKIRQTHSLPDNDTILPLWVVSVDQY